MKHQITQVLGADFIPDPQATYSSKSHCFFNRKEQEVGDIIVRTSEDDFFEFYLN